MFPETQAVRNYAEISAKDPLLFKQEAILFIFAPNKLQTLTIKPDKHFSFMLSMEE